MIDLNIAQLKSSFVLNFISAPTEIPGMTQEQITELQKYKPDDVDDENDISWMHDVEK